MPQHVLLSSRIFTPTVRDYEPRLTPLTTRRLFISLPIPSCSEKGEKGIRFFLSLSLDDNDDDHEGDQREEGSCEWYGGENSLRGYIKSPTDLYAGVVTVPRTCMVHFYDK